MYYKSKKCIILEEKMEIWEHISGPVVGAIIGYFTNYIAVKMLFRPKKEIKIFGHTVPFTPGAIPKRKSLLSKAVGQAVESKLLSKSDIKNQLLSSNTEDVIVKSIIEKLNNSIKNNIIELTNIDNNNYELTKNKIALMISNEIVNAANDANLGGLIKEKGTEFVLQKVKGGMLAMFLNEKTVTSFAEPLEDKLNTLIADNGINYIQPIVYEKLTTFENNNITISLDKLDITEDKLSNFITTTYRKIIDDALDKLLENLSISDLIEKKMNDMSVDDLENLVLSVMKKELNTIVNLGALIGFALGLINI